MALTRNFKAITPHSRPPAGVQDADVIDAMVEGDIAGITRAFTAWRAAGTPPLRDAALPIISYLEFSPRLTSVLWRAADLAAEESPHAYHNNQHFLETFVLAATLGCRARQNGTLDHDHFALLLAAALVHDYKHDGKGNGGEKLRLEKIAADGALPALQEAGLTDHEADLVRAFIYTTDITCDFKDPKSFSFANSVKKYSLTGNSDYLPPEVQILHDTSTADTALMLEDADLGSNLISVGLCRQNSMAVAQEMNQEYSPAMTIFFLNNICFGRAFSHAGREVIGPYIPVVLRTFGIERPAAFITTAPQPDLH